VEIRKERDDYPRIIAKPSKVKSTKTTNQNDFNLVNNVFPFILFL